MSLMSTLNGRIAYSRHIEGNQLSEQGKRAEADEKYKIAMEKYQICIADPNCKPIFLEGYSVLLMRFKRFEEAKDLLRRADKLPMSKPDKLKLRINFAICQWKTGKLDQAIELMENVFNDLKTSVVYGSLGYMYIEKAAQTGDFAKAIEFNNAAYDYDSDDAVILDNLGQLYLNMGDEEKALGYFERAHERKPQQVDTLYYLAKIYHHRGRDEEAKSLLDIALSGNYSALATTSREMAQELRDEL